MAQSAVVNAFMDRLAAHWAYAADCPVVDDDNVAGQTPANGSPYLTVQFPFSTSERISFGNPGANTHREEGAGRLIVHARRGQGTASARLWADALADLFRDKHFDGVQTFSPSSASTDDTNENGMYFVCAVAVPYRFDFIG
jgi:hypothetical protein